MARNPYFKQGTKAEQNLYESLVIESLKIYGQDVYYLPRTIVNEDTILGDDIPSKFSNAYEVEMYIESVDGFAGEGDLFQKFGIEIRDQATFVVARKRWRETVSDINNDIVGELPLVGDLIYLPLSKSLFQIMHVERESPFYQLQNLNVVRLECELFEYNDETFETGVEDIDIVKTLGYEVKLTLDNTGVLPIELGHTMIQTLNDGTTITATVSEWDSDQNVVSGTNVSTSDGNYHLFVTGSSVTFSEALTSRSVTAVEEDLGDHYYQNDVFDSSTVRDFMDFTTNNPFGEP